MLLHLWIRENIFDAKILGKHDSAKKKANKHKKTPLAQKNLQKTPRKKTPAPPPPPKKKGKKNLLKLCRNVD